MHIFFWILILAAAVLVLNLLLLDQMKRTKKSRKKQILTVTCTGAALIVLLCVLTGLHGSFLLTQDAAGSFLIEPQTYDVHTDTAHTTYSLCSTDGISFQFDNTELLSSDVPAQPQSVELYSCTLRHGFRGCYLNDRTVVRYLLK